MLGKMKSMWLNFLTSGYGEAAGNELLNQIKLVNIFSAIGICSTGIFVIVHFFQGSMITAWVEATGITLATVNLIYFRISRNYRLASSVILFIMLLLFIFFLIYGGLMGTGIYWFYTFPVLAFFLKGKFHGSLYMLFFYSGTMTIYLLYHYGVINQLYYSFIEIRQMLSSLAAVSLLVYYYEKTRMQSEEKVIQAERTELIKSIFVQQIEEAGEIQKTYIPQKAPQSRYMQIAGYYKPAMEIGGDYFDFFELDDNRTAIIICDVSSKGIPAALIMVKFRTMIKMTDDLKSIEPSQLLSDLNNIIANEIIDHMFITAIYLIINQKTGEVKFSNAGHLPITVYTAKDKKIKSIGSSDMPIGILHGQKYKDHKFNLLSGDIIALYTDGITETFNQVQKMYTKDRLHSQLIEYANSSAEDISGHIIKDIAKYKKGAIQNDDIAMVIVKIL